MSRYCRVSFKPKEAKDKGYSKKIHRDFEDEQIHKLPNEFRGAFIDYNHRSAWEGIGFIDENDYGLE